MLIEGGFLVGQQRLLCLTVVGFLAGKPRSELFFFAYQLSL
jgi:hypothetical protein